MSEQNEEGQAMQGESREDDPNAGQPEGTFAGEGQAVHPDQTPQPKPAGSPGFPPGTYDPSDPTTGEPPVEPVDTRQEGEPQRADAEQGEPQPDMSQVPAPETDAQRAVREAEERAAQQREQGGENA